MQKKLPIGISTLANIIVDNYVYVDKTKHVTNMVNRGKYYFLSRPRRFGKSLFLDTLKQAFLGNKELFKGLYLENIWDWKVKYPVIHLSFATGSSVNSEKVLLDSIANQLNEHANKYGIQLPDYSYEVQFDYLIKRLAETYNNNDLLGNVVVLIDEYDKPILDVIDNLEEATRNREILKSLYGVLKGNDAELRFVFITGVTKFAKAGIFSNLNNLDDISLDSAYADICGYTQSDVETIFNEPLAGVNLTELKRWYNGYNFLGKEDQKVYNPFDILLFISKDKIYKNYWFGTGTPTFLIKLLQKNNYYLPNLEGLRLTDSDLDSFDIDNLGIGVLLLQSGYLTIREIKTNSNNLRSYFLDYPNFEVKQSLNDRVLNSLFGGDQTTSINNNIGRLEDIFETNKIDQIEIVLKSLFASIPHDWYRKNNIQNYEGYYCSIVYTLFNTMGLNVIPEDKTNVGQIDLTIALDDKILIIEFKMSGNSNVKSALQQIRDNKYHEKYLIHNKPIYLIGIVFDGETRNICEYEWELL